MTSLSFKHVVILTAGMFPFSYILQEGVRLNIKTGCSLRHFLIKNCGISNHYIDDRIKTAFINQKPVDNYDTAIIHDQDSLALSGAMPGLIGAAFRKNSMFSPFRSTISYDMDMSDNGSKPPVRIYGTVTIKLFNLLIKEIGPGLLKKGVFIHADALLNIIKEERSKMNGLFQSIIINGQKQNGKEIKSLWRRPLENEWVWLVVQLQYPLDRHNGHMGSNG